MELLTNTKHSALILNPLYEITQLLKIKYKECKDISFHGDGSVSFSYKLGPDWLIDSTDIGYVGETKAQMRREAHGLDRELLARRSVWHIVSIK